MSSKKKSKKQKRKEKLEARRLAQLEAEERLRQKIARLAEIKKLQEVSRQKQEQYAREHALRLHITEKTFSLFSEIKSKFLNHVIKQREQKDWERYLRCDKLPIPSEPPSMNTYLYYWNTFKEAEYMDKLLECIEKHITLLSELQILLQEPLGIPEKTVTNLKEVRESYRSEISRKFDQGTFNIVRNMEIEMNRVDYWTVNYKKATKNIKVCMWSFLDFPLSELTIRHAPTIEFPELGLMIKLPSPYGRKCVVVRVIHVKFDALSDTSRTWQLSPLVPEGNMVDLVDYWYKKSVELQLQQWKEEAITLEKEKILLAPYGPSKSNIKDRKNFKSTLTLRKRTMKSQLKPGILSENNVVYFRRLSGHDDDPIKNLRYDNAEKNMNIHGKNLVGENGEESRDSTDELKQQWKEEAITHGKEKILLAPYGPSKSNIKDRKNFKSVLDCFSAEETLNLETGIKKSLLKRKYISEAIASIKQYELKDLKMDNDQFIEYLLNMFWMLLSMDIHEKNLVGENGEKSRNSTDELKQVVLDCFFAVETLNSETGIKNSLLIRKYISEATTPIKQYELKDLKMDNDKYKECLLNMFWMLPSSSPIDDDEYNEVANVEETSAIAGSREQTILGNLIKTVFTETSLTEINLRSFRILGGIYYFDLIKHPYQRFCFKDGSSVQIQKGKYDIERDDYFFVYDPLKAYETNKEGEEEIVEEEEENLDSKLSIINKLIHIEISLPEHILWFEAPTPVLWHRDEKIWSNQYVYDSEFDEENNKLNFKIGCALPIGLATFRYCNLPYHKWEVRPGDLGSNTVLFSLTASNIILDFTIKDDKVALDSYQNAPGTVLEPILGQYYSICELIKIMKEIGVDIFPDNDAFLYIENHSVKDYIVEDNVYMAMAIFSPYFQFSWSRWNSDAPWGTIIFQTRQYHFQKILRDYCIVKVDLFLSTILTCNENSLSFSDEIIPNIAFHPDLYTMLKNICSPKVTELLVKSNTNFVYTVYNFLRSIKFFCYS